MSFGSQNPYEVTSGWNPAALAAEDERATFVRRTYAHLAGAIALFVALEAAVFTLVPMATLEGLMQRLFASQWSWLVVLAGFMGVSWLAQSWANSNTSRGMKSRCLRTCARNTNGSSRSSAGWSN